MGVRFKCGEDNLILSGDHSGFIVTTLTAGMAGWQTQAQVRGPWSHWSGRATIVTMKIELTHYQFSLWRCRDQMYLPRLRSLVALPRHFVTSLSLGGLG